MSFDIAAEDLEKLEGCRVVASVSGGKDSAALSLWLTEQGIDHDRVFADTGWEHPDTYAYLRGPLTEKLGPITEVQSKLGGMVEWVRHKGIFPSRIRRWCTEKLKLEPIRAHLAALDFDCISAVGVRGGESKARSRMSRWEYGEYLDADVWRPLILWTEQDVIKMHQRHNLPPNPLYLKYNVGRVGCWPCIHSRKAEIRKVAAATPERIDLIRALEGEVRSAIETKATARGEKFDGNGYTFFKRGGGTGTVAIDEVVAWSRTAHGGRQLTLLDTEPDGCVRWGMCEGHSE